MLILSILINYMQIRRSISEILELCFCFSELVQGLGSGDVVFSSEKQNTLECITMVNACNFIPRLWYFIKVSS